MVGHWGSSALSCVAVSNYNFRNEALTNREDIDIYMDTIESKSCFANGDAYETSV
jgi:hypothetical protein